MAADFKRLMGTQSPIALGKTDYGGEEPSVMVLCSPKEEVEEHQGEAVITVPVYFNHKQRTATRRASELAGFKSGAAN